MNDYVFVYSILSNCEIKCSIFIIEDMIKHYIFTIFFIIAQQGGLIGGPNNILSLEHKINQLKASFD